MRDAASASGASTAPSLLIVEDEVHVREALVELLGSKGYQVDSYADGRAALEGLREKSAPDLIVLDLMMPDMNGWEFRVEQRRDPAWAAIPVIVLTADSSAQASAMDADGYLKKPVEAQALLDTVERLLRSREQARQQVHSAEVDRMSALGVLAAGLAHEINNPLAFVIGNLELAHKRCLHLRGQLTGQALEAAQTLAFLMDQAQHGAQRIAAVVRGVSTFARPGMEQEVAMDVQDVLESSLQLVANEIRHQAVLERDYAPVPLVVGNPAKLGQVFLNLLINAVHAIGEGKASQHRIRVSTQLTQEEQVMINVADTGTGIAPELLSRIFDPFFSTKEVGAGMGLGLAISQRLVSSMGGSIKVESAPGQGTTFSVLLPKQAQVEPRIAPPPPTAPKAMPVARRARILVIDDEAMMCDLLRTVLEDDYEVTALSSSRTALEHLLSGASYDLILCDLMMPELTGMDLYAELMRKRPALVNRIVFMTGGAFTARASQFLDHIENPRLMKPFRAGELQRLIEQQLAELQGPGAPAARQTYN